MDESSRLGPYELIKRLGFGGMAEIYLARTSGIGGFEKLLALKVIHSRFAKDQEFIDMLIDEAKIAVQLSHLNVCQIFDLGCIDGRYFIAMEFVDGRDLYQLLVRSSEAGISIPFDLIAFIGREMASGLHYAHTKTDQYGRPINLIHRDVSPQNVLVSFDGQVKLVDFGIAKANERRQQTESGVIKGKFFYMSPEQAWGDPLDGRSDVFSCGICLYEMVCGQMLYNEEQALVLLDKVRKAVIPPPRQFRPDLPEALERIIMKALSRDRNARYPSAGALKADLSSFLYGRWPGFGRQQLGDFIQQTFGESPFVMELPEEKPEPVMRPPPEDESLMRFDEFDYTRGQSVIFALNDIPEALKTDVKESFPGAISDEIKRRKKDGNQDGQDLSEDTFMESSWSETGEKTELLDSSLFQTSENLPATAEVKEIPISEDETHTSVFVAPAVAGPQRLHRPKARSQEQGPKEQAEKTNAAPTPTHIQGPKSLQTPLSTQKKPTSTDQPRPPSQTSNPSQKAPPVERRSKKPKPAKAVPKKAGLKSGKDTGLKTKVFRRLFSPAGISILIILGLLAYGVYRFVPNMTTKTVTKAIAIIGSVPDQAEIYLDGKNTGLQTEARMTGLVVGDRHELKLTLAGYRPHVEQIEVQGFVDGQGVVTLRRRIFLKRALGTLNIESNPAGAEVYLDSRLMGRTPVVLRGLSRQKEQVFVVLKKDGYEDAKKVENWGERTKLDFQFQLTKRP